MLIRCHEASAPRTQLYLLILILLGLSGDKCDSQLLADSPLSQHKMGFSLKSRNCNSVVC